MADQWTYFFGAGEAEGDPSDLQRLGNKGAGLAAMARLGLPVPPGFTISAEVGNRIEGGDDRLPDGAEDRIRAALSRIEAHTGRRFGDPANPLLVSVRSGARVSMPGMMSTILDVGMTPEIVAGLAARTGDPRFAWDTYRRFLSSYGNAATGIGDRESASPGPFESALFEVKRARELGEDDLDAAALEELATRYREIIGEANLPADPWAQLIASVKAVFRSWRNAPCAEYRALHGVPEEWGTSVTLCAMVFGNLGDDSATGVAFTRDPATGERRFFGEYLPRAQGEDVVVGARTPLPIRPTLEARLPGAYRELQEAAERLERHFRDMQDIEFTIERGKLWLLQTRRGERTARAAVRIAVDMVDEGLIDRREAVSRVTAEQLAQLAKIRPEGGVKTELLARGLPASPGGATGRAVFSADVAAEHAKRGDAVVLVRTETSPEDVRGMQLAAGTLTARGGLTCHAAIVARALGKPCVVGASEVTVDPAARMFRTRAGRIVREGDILTIDGTTGAVMLGSARTSEPPELPGYQRFLGWARAQGVVS